MGDYTKFNFVAMMFLEGNLSQRIKTKDCLWERAPFISKQAKAKHLSPGVVSKQSGYDNLIIISDKDDGEYIEERCVCNLFEERQIKNMFSKYNSCIRESTVEDIIKYNEKLLISPFDLDIYKGNKRIIPLDMQDAVTLKLVSSIKNSVSKNRIGIDVDELRERMEKFFSKHYKKDCNIDLINYYIFIRGMEQYNPNNEAYKKRLKLVTELKEVESTINKLFSKNEREQMLETLDVLKNEIIGKIRYIK